MSKGEKRIAFFLALVMVLAMAACGSSVDNGGSAAKTTPASGDVVAAELPEGWSLVSGTEMHGVDGADFICHAKEFELGDPYLQATKEDRDITAMRTVLESEDPFGTYYGSKELNNGTWYIAENAAATVIGEKVCLVRGYECDFESAEVQNILGSLQWAD